MEGAGIALLFMMLFQCPTFQVFQRSLYIIVVPELYPGWYGAQSLAMSAAAGSEFGQRRPTFFSIMNKGAHKRGGKVLWSLRFEILEDEAPNMFWQQLWAAIGEPGGAILV